MPRHPKVGDAEQALLDTYQMIEARLRRDLKISKAFCSASTVDRECEVIRDSYEKLLASISKALAVIRGQE